MRSAWLVEQDERFAPQDEMRNCSQVDSHPLLGFARYAATIDLIVQRHF